MTRPLTTFAGLLLAMLVGAAFGYVHGWDEAYVEYAPAVALEPNRWTPCADTIELVRVKRIYLPEVGPGPDTPFTFLFADHTRGHQP